MRARKRDPDPARRGEDIERRLARRVMIWAKTWKRCPKKGCRRARACQSFGRCAGVPKQLLWFTEREQAAMRRVKERERMKRGLPPGAGHDPDARDRDRPLPPPPERC